MYNGIGLSTPRGSGTNGYVQKNLGFVNNTKQKINYGAVPDANPLANRKPDDGVLAHDEGRQREIRCIFLEEQLKEDGVEEEEIERRVSDFRARLKAHPELLRLGKDPKRLLEHDTHHLAQAKQAEMKKLKSALGVEDDLPEGASFERSLK